MPSEPVVSPPVSVTGRVDMLQVNLHDPELLRDPYPGYAFLRENAPIYWNDSIQHWIVTRYEHVAEVMRDPQRFSSQSSEKFNLRPDLRAEMEPFYRIFRDWLVLKDEPDHMRLRSLVTRSFSPSLVKRKEGEIRAIAHALVDAVIDRGEMDLTRDFAFPLPAMVFGQMLGIRREDIWQVQAWVDGIAPVVGRSRDAETLRRGRDCLLAMAEYLKGLIRERAAAPADDLLSLLIAARDEGKRLSEDELISQSVMLLSGGHATTQYLISSGILALCKAPDQLALLRERPELMPQAVEELMRFTSPAQAPARIVAYDFDFHGHPFQKGDAVAPVVASANRDPAVFKDPDRLDITREDNRHLALGTGPHVCLGSALVRTEAPIAFEVLLERLPRLRLASDEEDWQTNNVSFRGLRRLPVLF